MQRKYADQGTNTETPWPNAKKRNTQEDAKRVIIYLRVQQSLKRINHCRNSSRKWSDSHIAWSPPHVYSITIKHD